MFVTIWMWTQEWSLISIRATAFTFATCHQPLSCSSLLTRSITVRSFRFARTGTRMRICAIASAGVSRVSRSASSETGCSMRFSVSRSSMPESLRRGRRGRRRRRPVVQRSSAPTVRMSADDRGDPQRPHQRAVGLLAPLRGRADRRDRPRRGQRAFSGRSLGKVRRRQGSACVISTRILHVLPRHDGPDAGRRRHVAIRVDRPPQWNRRARSATVGAHRARR